jgi:hypothetical protein
MAAAWQITIHGGFAWVFEAGDASVTVGPFRKPENVPDYHPHEMVLRVPPQALLTAETTLPFRRDGGEYDYLFVLRGRVSVLVDGREIAPAQVKRVNTPEPANGWNNFYYVYDANKYKEPDEANGRAVDWQKQLLATLKLTNGALQVLEPLFTTPYTIARKGPKPKQVSRPLATHILYTPPPNDTSPQKIVFSTDHGVVAARPAAFTIAADCGCPDLPARDREIPGFGVTFNMYGTGKDHLKFMPTFKHPANPAGALSPGPDCPPREYAI